MNFNQENNMVNLTNFIEPTVVPNVDENGHMGNPAFNTTDLLFIRTPDEGKYVGAGRVTDYALCSGKNRCGSVSRTEKYGKGDAWVRPFDVKNDWESIVPDDERNLYESGYDCNYRKCGVVPSVHFDLNAILEEKNKNAGFGKIAEVKTRKGRVAYRTIEIGYYPNSVCKDSEELENCFNNHPEQFTATGKEYGVFAHQLDGFKRKSNPEYRYQGNLYVRAKKIWGVNIRLADYMWYKIEPIAWEILNWDEMPKAINPNGNGKAKFIDAQAQEIFLRIPYYTNNLDQNRCMYQNSTVRGFLNGINVCNLKENGNPKFAAPNGGNFANCGFLQEAFIFHKDLLKEISNSAEQEKNKLSQCIINKDSSVLKNLDNISCDELSQK